MRAMSTRILLRGALCWLLCSPLLACGGDLGDDEPGAGTGGVTGTGGASGTGGSDGPFGTGGGGGELFCASPLPPTLDLEVTCASFVPALAPSEVAFVEHAEVAGMQGHRFRSTSDCGFDVVIALPNVDFVADDAPYEMSTWWVQGAGPLGLLAVVLRRPGEAAPLLAIAADGELDTLNRLLDPLAVRLDGPPCDATRAVVGPVLVRDESPLACEDAGGEARICHDGDVAYRLTSYPAPPESTDVPAVLGNAELMAPVIR
jgi:hypothetical protein